MIILQHIYITICYTELKKTSEVTISNNFKVPGTMLNPGGANGFPNFPTPSYLQLVISDCLLGIPSAHGK